MLRRCQQRACQGDDSGLVLAHKLSRTRAAMIYDLERVTAFRGRNLVGSFNCIAVILPAGVQLAAVEMQIAARPGIQNNKQRPRINFPVALAFAAQAEVVAPINAISNNDALQLAAEHMHDACVAGLVIAKPMQPALLFAPIAFGLLLCSSALFIERAPAAHFGARTGRVTHLGGQQRSSVLSSSSRSIFR